MDRDSVIDEAGDLVDSDARVGEEVFVTEMAREAVGLEEEVVGVLGDSDQAVIATAVHRHQVQEVMSVAIISEDQVAVEAEALAIAQAQADHTIVQEARKAADSKLNVFLTTFSPISL